MFRGLVLAILVMMASHTDAAQLRGVLHITVALVDGNQQVTPVPRYALLISDNPPSAIPRRVLTSLEGVVDVRLAPGTYTVESDQPVALEGKAYQWTLFVDIVDGRDVVLELTSDNAEVVPMTDAATSALAPLEAAPSSLLAEWQNSLVAIWTATAHGSGFLVDLDGLVVADQQVIGTATSVEVQLSPSVKVAGTVIASDVRRGVALIRISPTIAASVKTLPLVCDTPATPLAVDEAVVALEAPLGRLRGANTGSIERILTNVLDTDLRSSTGGTGGPAFGSDGRLIGLTTMVPERDGRRPEGIRIVPVGRVCGLIALQTEKISMTPPPSATHLPVELLQPVPAGPTAADVPAPATSPGFYQMSTSDFDIAFITPVQLAALQGRSDSNDIMERLRSNFSNWTEYVDSAPPVLMIRVTPKLVEGFWAKVARGAASTVGMAIPSIKRLKPDFASMRVLCGDAEIVPVHPFKLEHPVSGSDLLVEGFYAFDPGALTPTCPTVTLELFSEKDTNKADTVVVDPKVIQQIWQDFGQVTS